MEKGRVLCPRLILRQTCCNFIDRALERTRTNVCTVCTTVQLGFWEAVLGHRQSASDQWNAIFFALMENDFLC